MRSLESQGSQAGLVKKNKKNPWPTWLWARSTAPPAGWLRLPQPIPGGGVSVLFLDLGVSFRPCLQPNASLRELPITLCHAVDLWKELCHRLLIIGCDRIDWGKSLQLMTQFCFYFPLHCCQIFFCCCCCSLSSYMNKWWTKRLKKPADTHFLVACVRFG